MRAPKEPEFREREERAGHIEPIERAGRPERMERPEIMELPILSRDLSRWGPVFAGFVITLATIIVLGLLGAAVGLSIAGGITTAGGIWAAIVWLVALFVGGWLAARLSAVGGPLLGLVQGTLVWAFTLFFALILTALGAAALLGSVIGVIISAASGISPITDTTVLWLSFAALIIGLGVAALGGWIGARSTYEAPSR